MLEEFSVLWPFINLLGEAEWGKTCLVRQWRVQDSIEIAISAQYVQTQRLGLTIVLQSRKSCLRT